MQWFANAMRKIKMHITMRIAARHKLDSTINTSSLFMLFFFVLQRMEIAAKFNFVFSLFLKVFEEKKRHLFFVLVDGLSETMLFMRHGSRWALLWRVFWKFAPRHFRKGCIRDASKRNAQDTFCQTLLHINNHYDTTMCNKHIVFTAKTINVDKTLLCKFVV